MSHFCVFVFTKNRPDENELDRIMMPWHEFECTGTDNEYVVEVDKTDEFRETYAKKAEGLTERQFALDHYGLEAVIDSTEDLRRMADGDTSILDFNVKHKYGYASVRLDGSLIKLINRTNPNAKWDWYSIGGRWTGSLVPHYNPSEDPNNKETCSICKGTGKRTDPSHLTADTWIKCNGCDGTGIATKWPTQWKSVGDQSQLQNVPVIALRGIAEQRALRRYDAAMKIIANLTGTSEENAWEQIPDWQAILDDPNYKDIEAKRNAYWEHPVVVALSQAKDSHDKRLVDPFTGIDELRVTRSVYARNARNGAFSAFAVIDARGDKPTWHERGKMGFWAVVQDEKDKDQWGEEFSALVDAMDPLTWITVVDCHI